MLTLPAAIGLALASIIARVVHHVAQALTFDRGGGLRPSSPRLGRAGIRRAPSHAVAAIVFVDIFILFLTVAVNAPRHYRHRARDRLRLLLGPRS